MAAVHAMEADPRAALAARLLAHDDGAPHPPHPAGARLRRRRADAPAEGAVEVASLPTMIVWVGIGLQLFLAVTSLRVFGSERLVHWRETTPGSS